MPVFSRRLTQLSNEGLEWLLVHVLVRGALLTKNNKTTAHFKVVNDVGRRMIVNLVKL